MARTALGRVTAVFFVSALAVLGAAFLFLAMELSLINQAKAQYTYQVTALDCSHPRHPASQGGRELSADQTLAYVHGASNGSRYIDEGVSSILVDLPDGGAQVFFVFMGKHCGFGFGLAPDAHARGLRALDGAPI